MRLQRTTCIGVIACALSTGIARAQCGFDHEQTSGLPPSNSDLHMVYDPRRAVSILCTTRDSDNSNVLRMWEWDGTAWEPTEPSDGLRPPPRGSPAVVFDIRRGVVLLFGGIAGVALDDTWTWNPTNRTWTQCNTVVQPTGRVDAEMAFDSARGVALLFGGRNENEFAYTDTWELDGCIWSMVSISGVSPGGRSGASIAYDSARHRTVLFGGHNGAGPLGDTWEYDGYRRVWELVASSGPSARAWCQMAFDGSNARMILFGGATSPDGSSGKSRETWGWNGESWTRIAVNGPAGVSSHGLTYDLRHKHTVLYGGHLEPFGGFSGDTWELSLPRLPGDVVPDWEVTLDDLATLLSRFGMMCP